ncbi:MAG: hypothetical protein ACRCYC_07395 [Paraclostridium sp.]|uniref:hypothetical protein n=1 Tax=Paraclostridium sp. TaxID=2023273 RepID=UPI003F32C279
MKNFKIISIVLISILIFSGCSMNNKKDKEIDKATQQKNITKVQNDISEIMGKDYEYVINNMGKPYLTTYYINTEDYKNYKGLDSQQLLSELNLELVYPKEGYESSALYIDIEKNKVVDVESNEFVGTSSGFEDVPESLKSADIVVDLYNNQGYINTENIKENELKDYKGKNIENLIQNTALDIPNAVAYNKDKSKIINYYILDNTKENLKYIISITEQNRKITDIAQVSEASLVNSLVNLSN